MEQRISLVTLGVEDVAASRRFYERLGWRASGPGGDGVAFFQAGGMILSLYGRAELAADAGLGAPTPRAGAESPAFAGVALAHNVRSREEVAPLLRAAEAAGGRIVRPARDAFWGGHSGYFADPDGHLWEVAWNPHFPVAADGAVTLPG
jgi:catechol 2,3-dioxygenase-like lactoylglutathione lyase family enzyme